MTWNDLDQSSHCQQHQHVNHGFTTFVAVRDTPHTLMTQKGPANSRTMITLHDAHAQSTFMKKQKNK
jgi:hypothetical protein